MLIFLMKNFLILHSISSLGDGLLYFGLPVGLGLSTNDIRSTILMFLIPGIAIKLSSFLSSIISKRGKKSRLDYAKLLIILGLIEVIISIPLFYNIEKTTTIILCSCFVFIYAFLKEGIPRLLFSIEVYRYFCDLEDYKKLVSYGHVARMAFTFIGSLLASYLLMKKSWEYSLLIDSMTFIIYGLGLLFLGKDVEDIPINEKRDIKEESITLESANFTPLNHLIYIIPLMAFVSCLFYPYINVLIEYYGLGKASIGVGFTALVSFLVAIINLYYSKASSESWDRIILYIIPAVFIILSVGFNLYPSILFYVLITFAAQAYYSIFNTSDYNFRIKLPKDEMIKYNTRITRYFSIAQIISCIFALAYFSFDISSWWLGVGILIVGFGVFGIFLLRDPA